MQNKNWLVDCVVILNGLLEQGKEKYMQSFQVVVIGLKWLAIIEECSLIECEY